MPVTFTINSVDYAELGSFTNARDHGGYMFHDFGSPYVASLPTYTWGTPSNHFYDSSIWLGSSGSVTLGATVGSKTTKNSDTNIIPLNAAVSSGRHIFVVNSITLPAGPVTIVPNVSNISITDTVGGNLNRYDGYSDMGFAYIGAYTPSGLYGFHIWVNIYQIINSLSASDSITVSVDSMSYAGYDPLSFSTRLHVVNGLTLGTNPIGPNSGGNVVGFGDGVFGGPYTSFTKTGTPPRWVGPVFSTAVYQLASKPGISLTPQLRAFAQ